MSRRITVNVPDDVAERLAQEPNVSAFVTEAVRRRVRLDLTWRSLELAGYEPTHESRARGRRRIDEARARATPERVAESLRRLDAIERGNE